MKGMSEEPYEHYIAARAAGTVADFFQSQGRILPWDIVGMFAVKALLGRRFDYEMGGVRVFLRERPVNPEDFQGEEPFSVWENGVPSIKLTEKMNNFCRLKIPGGLWR